MFLLPVNRESRQFARLVDDGLARLLSTQAASDEHSTRSPALDVAETDSAYTVKLDMPGVAKEDVKVSVEGRQVTVQARRQSDVAAPEGERIVYRERSAHSYTRSFRLPTVVNQTDAHARLEQGVLTLTLPKQQARTAAQIVVN